MLHWRIAFYSWLLFVMSVTVATANSSYWNDWYWEFGADASHPQVGDGTSTRGRLGVMPDGIDIIGGSPIEIRNDIPKVYAAIYHENGVDDWQGSNGFYSDYYRSPVPLIPGSQKRWLFYVWATPTMPATDDIGSGLRFMNPEPVSEYAFSLKLVSKPTIISGGPVAGTSWQLDMTPLSLTLPMYRTDNGLTGYQFELTATAVPEPSSILAMLCGVGGMAGLILRRKQ